MPHALFLGSQLATHDRIGTGLSRTSSNTPLPGVPARTFSFKENFKRSLIALFRPQRVRRGQDDEARDTWTPYGERSNNNLSFVRAHYKHGIWDIIISLMGVAVLINSA